MHSNQFKPKSYLKLNKKYVFSEDEQFPLKPQSVNMNHSISKKKKEVKELQYEYMKIRLPFTPTNKIKAKSFIYNTVSFRLQTFVKPTQ